LININWGIGDWGLGIGDWGLGPIPNPQSPIPNPQSPLYIYVFLITNKIIILYYFFEKMDFKLNKNILWAQYLMFVWKCAMKQIMNFL